MTTIQTYTGRRFRLDKPIAEDVNLVDIAHSLSMICRYTGHCKFHYSVGQHSILVAQILMQQQSKYCLEGLFHDAAEAYYGDVSSPLKALLRESTTAYDGLSAKCEAVIAKKFGLVYPWPTEVHDADKMAYVIERRDVMHPSADVDWGKMPQPMEPFKLSPMVQADVSDAFLRLYTILTMRAHEKTDGPVAVVH